MSDYCLLYRSAPVDMWGDVDEILLTALRHNPTVDVTGLLQASPARYLQWLEGPEAAVRALYDRICTDPRHRDVELMAEGPLEAVAGRRQRLFGAWSMSLRKVDEVPESLAAFLKACDDGAV